MMNWIFCLTLLTAIGFAASVHSAEAANSQQTLSIIKPDAVAANHIGDIIARFEKAGLRIAAIKMELLSKDKAKEFYAVHKDRPFYEELTTFMSSGPIVAMVLEGNDAIAKNREIMGATDYKKAAPGTLRADFAQSVTKNAVHGSDSPETAKAEIAFFFKPNEIFKR
jgi:nucleoside-diphosphate kinase